MLDKETMEIHEKMRKHFTPLNNLVLIEFVENIKTSSGLYIAPSSEEAKSFAHPIVAIPSDPSAQIKHLKVGDWVVLRPNNVNIFKLYNRKFALVSDYEIMMVADMSYLKDEELFKKELKDLMKPAIN
jgi:co-chaperonin GroES (HSP10)